MGKANRKEGSYGLQSFLSAFHENMKTQGNFPSVILHHRAEYGARQQIGSSTITAAGQHLCDAMGPLCHSGRALCQGLWVVGNRSVALHCSKAVIDSQAGDIYA